MKKLILGIVIVLVPSVWLAFNLKVKRKYDLLKEDLNQQSYSIVQMDEETLSFLAEVQSEWIEGYSEVDGPHTDALELIDLQPSVANLIHVLNYQLPGYTFLSSNRNKKSAILAALQAQLRPMTIDDSIHVSKDGSIAFIHIKTNIVHVYKDETEGLREAMYYFRTDGRTESETEGTADERDP